MVDPVLHPLSVGLDAALLEVFPVLVVWLLDEIVFESLVVSHGEDEIEEGWITIDFVPGANDSDIVLEWGLEWELAWIMCLSEES